MTGNQAPTGLEILVDEKQFNDLLVQQRGAFAMVRQGLSVIVFVGFVVLYTVLALGEPLTEFRAFEGYIRRRFDTEAAMPISQVDSTSAFWEYVDRSIIPGIYGNETAKYFVPDYEMEKFLLIEGANRLYGTVRLRMVKTMAGENCKVTPTLEAAFPNCYGSYTKAAEDKAAYGPVDALGEATFLYETNAKGSDVCGKLACYGPGGFMQGLTSNYNKSKTQMALVEKTSWITQGTRAVFLDFTVYNFNSGYYAVCSMMFEVAPSGHWVNTFRVQILMERHLTPLGSGGMGEWAFLVGEGVLVVFVVRYVLEEVSEFIGFRNRGPGKMKMLRIKMEYFGDAWNILDWFNLLIIFVTFGIRITTWGKTPDVNVLFADADKQDLTTFADFSEVARNVRTIKELIAFNAVLTWFKAVKYIDVFPYIAMLMQTVLGSQRQLVTWFVIFFTSLVGFVLAFTFAFGSEELEFSTPWKTFVFLVRTLLGDSDMTVVHDAAPLTGSLLIVIFVVVVFFTVMQLFVSIMLGALQDAKLTEELKQAKQWQELVGRTHEFIHTVSYQFSLEARFKQMFPGLYYRMRIRKKKRYLKEVEREDEYEERMAKDVPFDDVQALGAASPSWGRCKVNKGIMVQNDDDDSGSEPDLGPLRHSSQLLALPADGMGRRGSVGTVDSLDSGPKMPTATEEDVVSLVLDATRYVADGIVERSGAARSLLFAEMSEAKDILANINSVLEVLSRRARDIELQQNQFTRHF